jgi:hypothetical protein
LACVLMATDPPGRSCGKVHTTFSTSPEPIPRPSPTTGHKTEILDVYNPNVGYNADQFPYQQPQRKLNPHLAPRETVLTPAWELD